MVPSDDQVPEVTEPGKRAFYFPTAFISSEFSPILHLGFLPVFPMRTDEIDASFLHTRTQRIRVTGSIVNDPIRLHTGSAGATTWYSDTGDGRFNKRHFVRGRRCHEVSQRNTLAVDHHHPLRTLSAFGLADFGPPFFAGAKLPSAKVSDQSSWPCSSSVPRSARQALSQISCSSQSRNRRQQVEADGYVFGRSFQRAPLRNTHKMPSNTGRLPIGLGPPLGDAFGSGRCGAIRAHCASVNS